MDRTSASPARLTRWEVLMYVGIIIAAAFIRVLKLDSIPPGLWYDEAIYALDGLSVANGHFPIFFETYGHMREPMYIYSLGGFFALFGHSTYHARLVSALWGIATVAICFPVARRFFGNNWGLIATLLLSTLRWHVHFSRTIFRAVLPPFFILAVIWFFLRWREHQRPRDAVCCGVALGAGMYTYLSFRLVPLILVAWVGWLAVKGALNWKRDRGGLGLIAISSIISFAPLGVDYLRHPVHFTGRTSEISMFQKDVTELTPDGEKISRRVAKELPEILTGLASNARDVALMWTVRGDHVGKHNLPLAPVFDWVSGIVFFVGLLWSVWNVGRHETAALSLMWLFAMCLTSILSFGAPNLLRMQGATPAVVFLYVMGLRLLYVYSGTYLRPAFKRIAIGVIIAVFSLKQLYTYFFLFPASPKVRQEFLTEMFYEPAEAVRLIAEKYPNVYVPEEVADSPTFRFVTAEREQVRAYSPSLNIPAQLTMPAAILVTARSLQLAGNAGRDPLSDITAHKTSKRIQRFYIAETVGDVVKQKHQWAELWTLQ